MMNIDEATDRALDSNRSAAHSVEVAVEKAIKEAMGAKR